ncbi:MULTISPECIES: glycosyltransferase family 2 protein [unclassified Pseudomonas]|uniref:glycosyltransferase family 2 protein n=1 Tax=unclassified Pseudomonas TaxID=196821 RepID=UPI000BCF5D26|nr:MULTISPECIES: glycosyltransferase family 2 protein [unclassified Pseudomonas]PVZ12393.1 glycosyltransferase Alg8 [Pseudomonas sp. URIL14HWK12:I12]PVZ23455.1 glycosyltransferase Alg8 [Pseudomonas sp. URIL14HWK12:I10]PVZ32785.1 glycosyltransferase Alg8 [Pseudomonas sp. URIL14HWK12:I11]SNZ14081.1 glycosyltransferase Alg8 [Pseudomonas sp. URIL14HWK12:I9]
MLRLKHGLLQAAGWLFYLCALMVLALMLPERLFNPDSKDFIFLVGAVGIWRYSMGAIHFVRGMIFLYIVYPWLKRKAQALGDATDPTHVYLMVTSFRIDAGTTAAVYGSVIREAINCGYPTTVVCSLVEMSDELLVKALWERLNPPERVSLDFVRIPGTGKRDGLAYGFRAISRHLPDANSVVAVIDGDTVLAEGVVRKSVPWFAMYPNVGGLTTNEFCEVRGGYIMSEWHKLRFAQRHINMCSMALSKRVLTMTGRMSMFRATVVTDPSFIADVESDSLQHWRLGRFKFLTGDDKSSWFSLMRLGYDTFYVPDAKINTVEHPPEKSFIKASRKLMYRWYGNNLRQNSRALGLGMQRLGVFTSVVLFDQRVSMWTSLLGLTTAIIAGIKYHAAYLMAYFLWIGITRLILTLLLSLSGHRIGPAYPIILYYNQIVGALMKIYVFFRLDKQSWTRQPTALKRDLASFQQWFNTWSSRTMTFSAGSIFVAFLFAII